MSRRIAFPGTLLLLIFAAFHLVNAEAEEVDTPATVEALQTRVSILETAVAKLQANSDSPAPEASSNHDWMGTILITYATGSLGLFIDGADCDGRNADDPVALVGGSQMTVTSAEGTILGVGTLETGKTVRHKEGGKVTSIQCVFEFEIPDVAESNFYTLSIAGLDETLTFTNEDLENQDYKLALQVS